MWVIYLTPCPNPLARGTDLLRSLQGTHDGLMPIEDSMLLFEHASPKEARYVDPARFVLESELLSLWEGWFG